VTNVTVKNTLITPPEGTGIELDHSSNNTIIDENNQDNYPLVNVIPENNRITVGLLVLGIALVVLKLAYNKRIGKK